MSLNKFAVGGLVALSAFTAHAADVLRCPDRLFEQGETFRLDGMRVFDGPPQELADLMPDLDASSWEIGPTQVSAAARGSAVYITCLYAGTSKVLTFRLPRDMQACKVEETRDGMVAGCSRSKSGAGRKSGRR